MSKKLIFSLAFAAAAATALAAEDVDERHPATPDGFVQIEITCRKTQKTSTGALPPERRQKELAKSKRSHHNCFVNIIITDEQPAASTTTECG